MIRQGLRAGLLLLAALASPARAEEVVVTFGGDVNFAPSRTAPEPDRVRKFGIWPLDLTTEWLAAEWDGDVNFVNVETVVSAVDGVPQPKTYVFRSHPDSFRRLMDLGVNAFGLSNNHTYDHGLPGLRDTLDFFAVEALARPETPLLFAGLGSGGTALQPRVIPIGGVRVAFSAIGNGPAGWEPGPGRVGIATMRGPGHYQAVLDALRDADADLRILSIHQGTENQVALDRGGRAAFRRAVDEAGVNLVLGHHPHVVRAVEAEPDRGAAIFHSLGNLLFVGGAIRDGLPLGLDYGLFGKAYFDIGPDGVRLTALEAVPLVQVHLSPRPMAPARARATLADLSAISRAAAGDLGVGFTPLGPDGDRGAACYGAPYGPRALALCCRVTRTLDCDLPDLM